MNNLAFPETTSPGIGLQDLDATTQYTTSLYILTRYIDTCIYALYINNNNNNTNRYTTTTIDRLTNPVMVIAMNGASCLKFK